MNREHAIGIAFVALLLGGLLLLSRRSTAMTQYNPAPATYSSGNIRMVSMAAEPRRYQNKETRRIEYNEDGLPTLIEITRDSVVA